MKDLNASKIFAVILAIVLPILAIGACVPAIPQAFDVNVTFQDGGFAAQGTTNFDTLQVADGSASAPSLSFTSDTDIGLFRSGANTLDIAIAGAADFQVTANDFTALSGSAISANTINETTGGSGVTVDSLVIQDGGFTVGATGTIDVNGVADAVILDADGDTTISSDVDDQIIFESSSSDVALIQNFPAAATGNQTAHIFEALGTTSVFTDGTNVESGVNIDLAVGNATGGTNSVYGLLIDDISGDAQVTETAVRVDGTGWDNGISVPSGLENIGLPTVLSQTITYTAAAGGTGTIATVADGEIWYIHAVFAQVTTNWDATGDDALVEIGDGNDPDGLLDLDDAELQAADTEGTGAPAGWQGFMSTDTRGAYLANGHGFIYAPSGSAETIDYVIDETSGETLAAGQLTVYVVYTRLQ